MIYCFYIYAPAADMISIMALHYYVKAGAYYGAGLPDGHG